MSTKKSWGITDPPTYTAGDVSKILKGRVNPSTLQRWDEDAFFRPSFYASGDAPGGLIKQEERDRLLSELGKTRGAPHRAYTYLDLVWMRLFLYVMETLGDREIPSPGRRAANILADLRGSGEAPPPHSSRLLFVDRDVYLLNGAGAPQCLTGSKQLPLTQIFADEVAAEVLGRIQALVEHKSLRSLSSGGASDPDALESKASGGS